MRTATTYSVSTPAGRAATAGRTTGNPRNMHNNYNLPAGYAAELTVRFHPLGKSNRPTLRVSTVIYYITAPSVAALKLLINSERDHQEAQLGTISVHVNNSYFTVTRPSKNH